MKVYTFGDKEKPTIMLFPGTCCYWKNNFGHVIEPLEEHFYTLVVSYSGFDETEKTTFISELDEVAKIEDYIEENLDGKLFAAYGCSLGGSFVSLLVDRQKIHIDHAIIGSSDMDQAPKWLAYLETSLMLPLIYPVMTGHPGKFMKKRMDKMLAANDEQAEYAKKFMAFMGIGTDRDFSFISKESVKNQFYTDLYTKVGDHIRVPGTTIHVFYAMKMGQKYEKRYLEHFSDPDIRAFDLRHEELLLDADRWVREVCLTCGIS